MPLNRDNMRIALQMVHTTERTSTNPNGMTRVQAVEDMIRNGPDLTHAELDIILSSLHVSRTELTIQFK